jgi:hypothetical protein
MATMRVILGLFLFAVAAALALNTAKSLGELPDRDPGLWPGTFLAVSSFRWFLASSA